MTGDPRAGQSSGDKEEYQAYNEVCQAEYRNAHDRNTVAVAIEQVIGSAGLCLLPHNQRQPLVGDIGQHGIHAVVQIIEPVEYQCVKNRTRSTSRDRVTLAWWCHYA